jgi:hypothetical protein
MNNHILILHKDGNPEKVEEDIITYKVVGSIITARGEVTLNTSKVVRVCLTKRQTISESDKM